MLPAKAILHLTKLTIMSQPSILVLLCRCRALEGEAACRLIFLPMRPHLLYIAGLYPKTYQFTISVSQWSLFKTPDRTRE